MSFSIRNFGLGRWLLEVRELLVAGKPIDLREGQVDWISCSKHASQLRVCFDMARKKSSVVAIRGWANQCHHLARYLNNTFRSLETVECEDLLNWCERLEKSKGINRVKAFIGFVNACISRLPSAIGKMVDRLSRGKPLRPRRDDIQNVANALVEILRTDTLRAVEQGMAAIEQLNENLVYARYELWKEMRKTLRNYDSLQCDCLRDRAWRVRDVVRKIGRPVDSRCLSTTLLVKGLEFDHAVILDADDLKDAENLYVAMTRGSKSVTVLSENPIIQRRRPRFLE